MLQLSRRIIHWHFISKNTQAFFKKPSYSKQAHHFLNSSMLNPSKVHSGSMYLQTNSAIGAQNYGNSRVWFHSHLC